VTPTHIDRSLITAEVEALAPGVWLVRVRHAPPPSTPWLQGKVIGPWIVIGSHERLHRTTRKILNKYVRDLHRAAGHGVRHRTKGDR
jgi:hypothetical protein